MSLLSRLDEKVDRLTARIATEFKTVRTEIGAGGGGGGGVDYNLGAAYKGAWSKTVAYGKGDVVTALGRSWVARVAAPRADNSTPPAFKASSIGGASGAFDLQQPEGTTTGDFQVLLLTVYGDPANTAPADFTLRATSGGGTVHLRIYTRVVGSDGSAAIMSAKELQTGTLRTYSPTVFQAVVGAGATNVATPPPSESVTVIGWCWWGSQSSVAADANLSNPTVARHSTFATASGDRLGIDAPPSFSLTPAGDQQTAWVAIALGATITTVFEPGSTWAELGALARERATATHTTASLAAAASEAGAIALAKSYHLLSITTDRPCRVRLYATVAQRDADAARAIGTDPTGNHGLMLEYVSTAGVLAATLSPAVDGTNLEAVPTSAVPISIQNLSGSTSTVQVGFVFLGTE